MGRPVIFLPSHKTLLTPHVEKLLHRIWQNKYGHMVDDKLGSTNFSICSARWVTMADYAEMYETLFRAITRAMSILKDAQIKAEEMYISSDDQVLTLLPPEGGGDIGNHGKSGDDDRR